MSDDGRLVGYERDFGNVCDEIREMTLFEVLRSTASKVPGRMALWYFGTKITFSEMLSDTLRVAHALYAIGVRKGD